MTSKEIQKQIKDLQDSKLELHRKIYGMLLDKGIEEAELFSKYSSICSDIAFQNYRQGMAEGKEIYAKSYVL